MDSDLAVPPRVVAQVVERGELGVDLARVSVVTHLEMVRAVVSPCQAGMGIIRLFAVEMEAVEVIHHQ